MTINQEPECYRADRLAKDPIYEWMVSHPEEKSTLLLEWTKEGRAKWMLDENVDLPNFGEWLAVKLHLPYKGVYLDANFHPINTLDSRA